MVALDEAGFDASARPGVCVVVFGADHCRPSRVQLDEVDRAMELSSGSHAASIDALIHDDARRKMNVRCLPATFIFRDGALAQTMAGLQSRHRIEAAYRGAVRSISRRAA